MHIYKILAADDWAEAQKLGHSRTALDVGDGYVHLSTRGQVGQTLALHYKDTRHVRLIEYAVDDLAQAGEVKWEPSRGGDLFPHLYGDLPMAAALRVWVLGLNDKGVPALPEDL